MFFSALGVFTEEEVEDPRSGFRFGGHDADETAGVRVHGGHPHHLRVVLAETLGALEGGFLAVQLREDVRLFLFGVGKPGLAAGGDLVEGGLGDVDVALLNEGGGEPPEHG